MPSETSITAMLMSATTLSSVVGAAALSSSNHALSKREGINCEGSSECGSTAGNIWSIQDFINTIDDNYLYNNGQHIACNEDEAGGGLCAFLQNTAGGGISGSDVKGLLQDIIDHGCTVCGSVPTGSDDVSQGELTVNYVSDTEGCNGACAT